MVSYFITKILFTPYIILILQYVFVIWVHLHIFFLETSFNVRRSYFSPNSPAGKGAKWEWAGDSGDWYTYDMEVQCFIEGAWAKVSVVISEIPSCLVNIRLTVALSMFIGQSNYRYE